jgi:hypothetical protein
MVILSIWEDVCNEELRARFSSYYIQDIYTFARIMPFFAQNIVFLTDITVHGNQNIINF